MNISQAAAQIDLSDYNGWKLAASLSADGSKIALNKTNLDLGAYGVAVLVKE